MELRQLRYFLAVARTLNFTKAAEEVHIAQPPLSRQIGNLETELGVCLLERSTRGVRLTAAGVFFQDRATEILTRVERLKRETSAFRDSRRRVFRVGFDISVMYGRAPAIVRYLRGAHPELDFELVEVISVDQQHAIRTGEIDFGVGRSLVRDDHLEQASVKEEPLMLALPSDHPACRGPFDTIRLHEVSGDTFILYADRSKSRSPDPVLRFFESADFKPAKTIAIGDLSASLGLVASGSGVSVVPAAAMRMRSGDISYARLDEVGAISPIVLSTMRGANSAMLRGIIEELGRLAEAEIRTQQAGTRAAHR